MKNSFKNIFLSIMFLIGAINASAQVRTRIVGEVINSSGYTNEVKIFRKGDDFRQSEPLGVAKLGGDNTFDLTIKTPIEEVCQLVMEVGPSGWEHRDFCTYSGVVEVLMDCNSFANSTVSGGVENEKLTAAQQHFQELYSRHITPYSVRMRDLEVSDVGIFSHRGQEVVSRMQNPQLPTQEREVLMAEYRGMVQSRTFHSVEFYALEDSLGGALPLIMVGMAEYDVSSPSLFRFGELVYNLSTFDAFTRQNPGLEEPLELLRESFTALSAAYPSHPYTARGKALLSSLSLVSARRYIDFIAPDLDGNMVRLSEQIGGKVALLDMWASWCGPCLAKSASYIPVYEKYRERGFVIVGVAREYKNTDAMWGVVQSRGYAWQNLVELDNSAGLWDLYGLGNTAGKVFLIDQHGVIVAENPTADELEAILQQIF